MKNEKKQRILLLAIFGPLILGIIWLNNPTIENVNFRETSTLFVWLVIIGYSLLFLAFIFSDKTIPPKKQQQQKKTIQKLKPAENDPIVKRWMKLAEEEKNKEIYQ